LRTCAKLYHAEITCEQNASKIEKKNISIEGEVTWKIKAASFFIEHVYYAAE